APQQPNNYGYDEYGGYDQGVYDSYQDQHGMGQEQHANQGYNAQNRYYKGGSPPRRDNQSQRQPPAQRGRGGGNTGDGRGGRPLQQTVLEPKTLSPVATSWDNPFPTFPG